MTASESSGVWLVAATATTQGRRAIDLWAPHRTAQVTRLDRPPPECAGALLVGGTDPGDAVATAGGGLVVSRELFWSLLAPDVLSWPDTELDGSRGEQRESAPDGGEGELIREARAVWNALADWTRVPPAVRREIVRDLDAAAPRQGRIVDALDRLHAHGGRSPFAGWAPRAGGKLVIAADGEAPPGAREPLPPPPTDPEELRRWMLEAEGLGALFGRDFEGRPEQARMAALVAEALAEGRALAVEAGTGVGKTLAYLVPLIARLTRAEGERNTRAVVATHTRALQRQILSSDWPRLTPLTRGLPARLLMGRSNYLCRRAWTDYLETRPERVREAARHAALRAWLAVTGTGMREELVGHPVLGAVVPRLFDTLAPCSHTLCFANGEGGGCFVQRARRRAREARLLIVNHALLLQDSRADNVLIGPYDHLVIDEAHQLPTAALATWSVVCDRTRTAALAELAGSSSRSGAPPRRVQLVSAQLRTRPNADAAAAACTTLGRSLDALQRNYGAWWDALDRTASAFSPATGVARVRDKDLAFAPLRPQTAALLESLAAARTSVTAFGRACETVADLGPALKDELALLAQCAPLLDQLTDDVRRIVVDPDERWVAWCEASRRGGLRAVGAKPLLVGELLREVWVTGQRAPVVTSATLSVAGDFTHMLGELGLDRRRPATVTRELPSPFDFLARARILAPDPATFPGPEEARHAARVEEVLRNLVSAVPRRIMALFTSYRLLEAVAERLRAAEPPLFAPEVTGGAQLLVQRGAEGTAEVLRRFRAAEHALLLGTSTFWEGVDLPGAELEVLVVTKLPFRVPSDPWVSARCDWLEAQGENPFTSFMVRDAVLRLRQGVGRLLRRQDDRGLVVLLDTRLHTREYGTTFLDALPGPCAHFRDGHDLVQRTRAFFASI